MASLASTAVTRNRSWPLGDRTGKLVAKVLDLTLVLTGQGGSTNKILASVLGLSEITSVRSCMSSTNVWIPAAPSYDGTYIVLFDPTNATDATRGAAADITATVRVIVEGRE